MARGDYLRNLTPEQMAAFQAKRVATMRAKKAEKKEIKMQQAPTVKSYPIHPDTDAMWAQLAREHGFRLPHRNTPLTTGGLKLFLRRAGISTVKHNEWVGLPMREYVKQSHWPLRAVVGLALEHKDLITQSA